MKTALPVLLFSSCLLAGCAARQAAAPAPREVVAYPQSFKAQHRMTLTFRGKQADFTGYLLVRKPAAWRAVGIGELAGTMFDVVSVPGQGPRVVRNSGGIPAGWLKDFAADIVEMLYLSPACAPAAVPGSGSEPVACRTKNSIRYELEYSDYAALSGVEREAPRRVIIRNASGDLRLEAELLKLEPVEIPESHFAYEQP